MRVGNGYDIHRLCEGKYIVLGGVKIPFDKGFAAHSDGDVLIHAVIDSLFGAAALGDIGSHFPDTDPQYKDIDSMKLLLAAHKEITKAGYGIVNIDSTVIAEKPKLQPYISMMRKNISSALNIDISKVSVKAKTNEGLGETGGGEAVAAFATCLLNRI